MTERVNWARQFREANTGQEGLEAFVQRAAIGLETLGPTHYFTDLYSSKPGISPADQTKSVFTGSVAYRCEDLASEAYALLVAGDNSEEVNRELINRLNEAIRHERRGGNYTRIEELESAAKALGMPLRDRLLGGFATALAIHFGRVRP